MTQTKVNVRALHAALDAARESKGLSWRQLAKELELSPSTLSRLANEHNPDVNAFASMVKWLRMPAENFIVSDDSPQLPQERPDLVAQLAPLLRARGDLEERDIEHLEELISSAVRRFSADRAAAER